MSDQSMPLIQWEDEGQIRTALWRSERGAKPPRRIVIVDDTLTADVAFRHASEGTGLLWYGDFQNGRQLLQALIRRIDQAAVAKSKKAEKKAGKKSDSAKDAGSPADRFNQHRMIRAQRASILGMLLIPIEPDYQIALRRAPDVRQACIETWGEPATPETGLPEAAEGIVVSLRELQGVMSAHEWRLKGVEIAALGGPYNRIHPHYAVFSPVRGEYIDLVAAAPLPENIDDSFVAFDIGTGSGVLAALLARRGVHQVVATENDARSFACARENIARLGLNERVSVEQTDLFPTGQANLIVCNPPWIAARPSAPIERSVYDENSVMLTRFLDGVLEHLLPDGEIWLVMSDIGERLGLRTRESLMSAIEKAGLIATGRANIRPRHPKASDKTDPLYEARSGEVTSLWRLVAG